MYGYTFYFNNYYDTRAPIDVPYSLHRKVHTQSAKKWLGRLHKEKVPTLVCLTFGDKLYAEHMSDSGGHPRVADMSKVIKSQLSVSYVKQTMTVRKVYYLRHVDLYYH